MGLLNVCKNIFFGKPLRSLIKEHNGKIMDKWDSYIGHYESEFAPFRNRPVTIIELGVQNCGSLEVWGKYFKNAKSIIGVDIVPSVENFKFKDRRIETLRCDAKELHTHWRINGVTPTIIIDDASHQSNDIIKSFINLFPKLADGGLYIVEDLCCSYWGEFNDKADLSSMEFFKSLVDLVNFEHWPESYQGLGRQNICENITSIKFFNSMCVISKGNRDNAKIGPRVVVGKEAPLGFQATHGQDVSELNVSRSVVATKEP